MIPDKHKAIRMIFAAFDCAFGGNEGSDEAWIAFCDSYDLAEFKGADYELDNIPSEYQIVMAAGISREEIMEATGVDPTSDRA